MPMSSYEEGTLLGKQLNNFNSIRKKEYNVVFMK
jgi:hypothetical protein